MIHQLDKNHDQRWHQYRTFNRIRVVEGQHTGLPTNPTIYTGCKETSLCYIILNTVHSCSRKQRVPLYYILGYIVPFFVLVQDVTSTIISPEPEPDSNNGLLWPLWHWLASHTLFIRYFCCAVWWEIPSPWSARCQVTL